MTIVHVRAKYKRWAISLRKEGKTYSEILVEIPVAKSTLSLWLQEVQLAKKQKQLLTAKKLAAGLRGGLARKNQRIKLVENITNISRKEIGKLSDRELWLIGVALYWAEGTKSKIYNPSMGIVFTNSDYQMVQIFVNWLKYCCGVKNDWLFYEIYIHESCRDKIQQVIKFWSLKLQTSESNLQTIRYKKNKINTKRKNVGDLYNGCLRVKVRASSTLNRKIVGLIEGITQNLK